MRVEALLSSNQQLELSKLPFGKQWWWPEASSSGDRVEKIEATVLKPWEAFTDDPKPQTALKYDASRSVRTRNGLENKKNASGDDGWGSVTEGFTADPASGSSILKSAVEGNTYQGFNDSNSKESKSASQLAGCAGFQFWSSELTASVLPPSLILDSLFSFQKCEQ
ncbi:hypothetical protein Nepgr_006295 [Nepenthes gracilis]|uniref:Uncharacterized protein n=1 Tax=Nepenthes gracilis TaxID=150966 RepID=A0AAD3XHG3_NEPGR|nr:hypothetical protein Nepgr_006295 [Nepenthes gracilis]